jgi:hypothetical protein
MVKNKMQIKVITKSFVERLHFSFGKKSNKDVSLKIE